MRISGKKMKAATLIVVPVLLFLLPAAQGGCAETAEPRLTLAEAVRTALENNHELKAQKNAQAAKKEEIGIARSFLLPKVALEERYLRTVNPGYAFMTKLNQKRIASADFEPDALNHPAAIDDFQTTVSVEQPLFVRKASLGLEMSKTETAAAEQDLRRRQEETVFRVVRSYLTVGTAAGFVTAAERALADAQEHQRLAEVRYSSGLGLYSDSLRAATAVAEARQKLVSAVKNLQVAKRALGMMIGSAGPVDISPAPPELPSPSRGVEYFREQALARTDLKSLELRKENAHKNIALAGADYFPSLGVGGSYLLNDHSSPLGAEGDSWQVTAFLKWDLFDGTKRKHEKTKAVYEAKSAEENLEGMKKAVAFQVEEAWLSIEEAKKNLELAKESLKSAEEGNRPVKVRYEGSLSPLVDLLDSQVSLDRARANLVARENEYTLASANLSYASGTILKDLQLD